MTNTPLTGNLTADSNSVDQRTTPSGGWLNPGPGFLILLGIGTITAAMALVVPGVLTTSLKASIIDPEHPAALLSLVQAISGLAQLISLPLFGRLSDRTISRLGRRRPFILMGAALLAIGTVTMLLSTTAPVLVLGSVLLAFGYVAVIVMALAVIPDQLAPNRRGPASAVVGLSLPVGALAGLFVAQLLSPNLALMILVPGLLGVVGNLLLGALIKDRVISRDERPRFSRRALLETYWVSPRRNPSFALAWTSRLLIFVGINAVQSYQVFYLIAILHVSVAAVAQAVFVSTLALTASALVFATIAAKMSDVAGRRKPFVIASAGIFAVGLALAATATSFEMFLVAIAVIGAGQGVYLAVDVALVTQVIPDAQNAGKDLGLMALSSSLALALVPAVAPAILAIGASVAVPQNYPALFIVGALAGVIGAVLIVPIRKVR